MFSVFSILVSPGKFGDLIWKLVGDLWQHVGDACSYSPPLGDPRLRLHGQVRVKVGFGGGLGNSYQHQIDDCQNARSKDTRLEN